MGMGVGTQAEKTLELGPPSTEKEVQKKEISQYMIFLTYEWVVETAWSRFASDGFNEQGTGKAYKYGHRQG